VDQVQKRILRVIAIVYLALGVAEIVGGAVSGKLLMLATGVIWLLAGACGSLIPFFVQRRRERSAPSKP